MAKPSYVSLAFFAGLCIFLQDAGAAVFEIRNQCTFTVWPAGLPGGGTQLQQGQNWTLNIPAGTSGARFWGRTGCSFNQMGTGSCQTGDCGGLLNCAVSGAPPTTLVEYTLTGRNNMDTYDLSLIDGFNVPVSVVPSTNSGDKCRQLACSVNITSSCPSPLKVDGGCKSACNVLDTDAYCCTGSLVNNCPPTNYSKFFKNLCPDAYSYAKDDMTSTFVCPVGTNYGIVFCP